MGGDPVHSRLGRAAHAYDERSPARRHLPLIDQAEPPKKASGLVPAVLGRDLSGEAAVIREISENLAAFEEADAKHRGRVRELLAMMDPSAINNLRYKVFAPHYDGHMASHERAIGFLLDQLVSLEGSVFGEGRLISDDLLEMSCGTGAVIGQLCRAVGGNRAAGLRIIANDISEDMKQIALEKTRDLPADVTFTSQDVSYLSFPAESLGTIILSQTLHLILDESAARAEREGTSLHGGADKHFVVKYWAISRAWNAIRDGGTFILIDEWPALFSERGGPLGPGFAYLFNEGLKPIEMAKFQNSIMKNMAGAKPVADLVVPIDSKHSMHLLAYQKTRKRTSSRPLPELNDERASASGKVLEAFQAVDPTVIESRCETDPNHLPISENIHFVRFPDEPPGDEGRYNCVVVDRCLHKTDPYDRLRLIDKSIRSLKKGGSLIIVDEWDPPDGSPFKLRLSDIDSSCMVFFSDSLTYVGSLRLPIVPVHESRMHGLQYRKDK
ncbi:MAG: class I SAM-dependent methyltransferase [Candidatus Micrarchaeia archaeon]